MCVRVITENNICGSEYITFVTNLMTCDQKWNTRQELQANEWDYMCNGTITETWVTADHSNSNLKKNVFNCIYKAFISSEVWLFHSIHNIQY